MIWILFFCFHGSPLYTVRYPSEIECNTALTKEQAKGRDAFVGVCLQKPSAKEQSK